MMLTVFVARSKKKVSGGKKRAVEYFPIRNIICRSATRTYIVWIFIGACLAVF